MGTKQVKIFEGTPEEVQRNMNEWLSKNGHNISDVVMTQSSVCPLGQIYQTYIAVTIFFRFDTEK